MKQARSFALLLAVLMCCCACGAPSLRHKKNVNKLLAAGEFGAAQQRLETAQKTEYKERDRLLYQLDTAAVLHDGGQYAQSDARLAAAQDRIEELFTKSVSAHAAQYFINDLTVSYRPAAYERALTYYYRAMNFLSVGDIRGALVEANRAAYYLDHSVRRKSSGQNTEAFIQYFMSLVFESAGKLDDARIVRTRAAQVNPTEVQALSLPALPAGYGEVVIVHANGVAPLKKSQTFQVAWGDVWLWINDPMEGDAHIDPSVRNAISAGLLGNAVTLAYPVLELQPFEIQSSEAVTAQGEIYPTRLLGDVSAAAESDLKEKERATLFRMAVRAAAKRVATVQANHAVTQAAKDSNAGMLAEMFVSFLGALTEKADTRQWFTLPAQFRIVRFYVPAGQQDITLRLRNGYGKIVGEYIFEKVSVPVGGRVYLHHRTAK